MGHMTQGYRMLLRAAGRAHYAFSDAKDDPSGFAAIAIARIVRWQRVEARKDGWYSPWTSSIALLEYESAERSLAMSGYLIEGHPDTAGYEY